MNKNSYKILIVDDDTLISDMYTMKFRNAGHDVTVVVDSEEALAAAEGSEGFDVFLLDLVMPGTNGFELLEELSKRELIRHGTVIILTNQSREEDIKKAESLGAKGYIVKASSVPSEVVISVLEILQTDTDKIILKH